MSNPGYGFGERVDFLDSGGRCLLLVQPEVGDVPRTHLLRDFVTGERVSWVEPRGWMPLPGRPR
ncbi:MAG: hypothetical protein AAGH15_05350 [Myxococcota bacterium]